MNVKTIPTFECEIVKKEYQLVGLSITANLTQSFPESAMNIHNKFEKRRDEIKNSKNKEILFSPYMSNGIFATYFACLEVDEISDIPKEMIGFKLPIMEYAQISCSNKTIDQGYATLFSWMDEKGYKRKGNDQSCPIEIFYLEEDNMEEVVELLIPIQ